MSLSRREFLGGLASAGALILGFPKLGAPVHAATAATNFTPGIWLAIAPDDVVTIVTHRSEMGTGVRSCLPMVVAEELGADLKKVKIEQAIGDEKYGSQNTDGSRSVRDFTAEMRKAGASARLMLERAAAAEWKVPASECTARDHAVHHTSGKSLAFGALTAAAAALKAPDEKELRYRDPKDYKYVGKALPTFDQLDIVTGKGQFGIDVKLDGMKYAAVARCPVIGGTLKSHDAAAALKVPGVEKVVVLPHAAAPYGFNALGGVAVVAKDTWAALAGRDALKVEWDLGANASYDTATYQKELEATVQKPGEVVLTRGDATKVLAAATRKHTALYSTPHLAHAAMEPLVATAHWTKDGVTAWAPVQNPQAAQDTLAATFKLAKEDCVVHVTLLGGGFGRKSKPDFVAEAALISKEVGAPVKVQWTREDDMHHDYYHSNAAVYCEAALDDKGAPTAWLQRTAFPSISSTFAPGVKTPSVGELGLGFTDVPYAIPNLQAEKGEAIAHVRIGWLRSVCNVWHAFALSSFADELARLAGKDPLAYLLDLIGPDRKIDPKADNAQYENYDEKLDEYPIDTGRLRAVLERCAKEAGWGKTLPKGQGLGIAVHRSFTSYVAVATLVDVTKEGRLSVPRVDVVLDCGQAINVDRVRSQMEGSMVFSHSLAMTGEITAQKGAVQQSNYHDYKIARIHEAPRDIHVHLIESTALPGGVGEPGVPPYAPALANAIHAATGKRIRALPFAKADLSWS